MACYRPLQAYRSRQRGKSGKVGVTFNRKESAGIEIELPCGRCIGCRIDLSRDWAIRMMHEAAMHRDNSFVTLTYNEEHLPYPPSLDVSHFQLFMKRLRKKYPDKRIRYYHCGEYGNSEFEPLGRPHYHAILFGVRFEDEKLFTERQGCKLYTSEILQNLWFKGFATVGNVTWESAAYVARYVTKKMTGDKADHHYWKMDERTGEVLPVSPEYSTMSRRPGIGSDWFKKYTGDVFPHDACIHPTKKVEQKVPRYYSKLYEADSPEEFKKIRSERIKKAKKKASDNTPERLAVREFVKHDQVSRLKRTLQ